MTSSCSDDDGNAGCYPNSFHSAATSLKGSLGQSLIPLADQMRDLLTQFGLRPYEVKVIRTRWTGGRRGVGAEVLVSELMILPTPKIGDLNALQEMLSPVGVVEVGSLLLQEVSGTYTENELRGYDRDGTPPAPDEQVFYEVTYYHPSGQTERRRFVIRSAPYYDAGKLGWTFNLEKAAEDRDGGGGLR